MTESTPELVAAVERSADRYTGISADIDALGRDRTESITEAIREIERLCRDFEDRATGTGDFGGYIQFRHAVTERVEDLPDDVPGRERFERIAEIADQRRLSTSDFEAIRSAIADVRAEVPLPSEETDARSTYQDARRDARQRIGEIEDRIDELDRLASLADVDLDAPVEDIHDPIEAYNEAVEEAFTDYLDATAAREVLSLFELTDRYPLVDADAPPPALLAYLDELREPLTIPELLAYADYSRSKLDHYVADPDALITAVRTDRTYLERRTADPFRVAWPPPEATSLRWRLREIRPLVDRFADEETIAALRTVRERTRDTERFERLRAVAIARSEIDEAQRERIRTGRVADERAELVDERERLEAVLDAHPAP